MFSETEGSSPMSKLKINKCSQWPSLRSMAEVHSPPLEIHMYCDAVISRHTQVSLTDDTKDNRMKTRATC